MCVVQVLPRSYLHLLTPADKTVRSASWGVSILRAFFGPYFRCKRCKVSGCAIFRCSLIGSFPRAGFSSGVSPVGMASPAGEAAANGCGWCEPLGLPCRSLGRALGVLWGFRGFPKFSTLTRGGFPAHNVRSVPYPSFNVRI